MKLIMSLLCSAVALGLMLSPLSAKEVQPFSITPPVVSVDMTKTNTTEEQKDFDFGHEDGS